MPPANQAFRGASLYSGIFDTHESNSQRSQASSTPAAQHPTDPSQATGTCSAERKSDSASDSAGANTSKSSGWSAALRFAPRRTAAAAKAKARPNAAFVASFAPVAPSSADMAEPPKGALSRAPGVAPKPPSSTALEPAKTEQEALPAKTAEPAGKPFATGSVDTSDLKLTALALPNTDADDAWLLSQLGKHSVPVAPPFTLPPEELERDKALILKAAAARGEHRHYEHAEDDIDGAEDDEDVNGFWSTSAGKRASKKRKKRKRGGSPPAGPNMNAEYDPRIPNDYLAYRQLVYDRRTAELEFQRWQKEQAEQFHLDQDADRWEEDEEARAKEEPQRRLDRFPPPPPSPSLQENRRGDGAMKLTELPPALASVVSTRAETGEEAYQRRIALSKAVSGEEAYQRRVALSQGSAPYPPVPPPGPPPGPPPAPPDLVTRQTATAAIAARLAKVAPSALPPTAQSPTGDPATFASRLMASQGYVAGSGLGASLSGMTTPLTAHASRSNRGHGVIVDPSKAAHSAAETARFGRASSVIVLLNTATPNDLADETTRTDLVEDIASECTKLGTVSRILPHTVQQLNETRVFVRFTGCAASWNAVRTFSGRWFEGRQLAAFYYDETAFDTGRLDLPLPNPEPEEN